MVGQTELFSLGNATSLEEGKILNNKKTSTVKRIYNILLSAYLKNVSGSSKQLHHNKQIACVVHLLNFSLVNSYRVYR